MYAPNLKVKCIQILYIGTFTWHIHKSLTLKHKLTYTLFRYKVNIFTFQLFKLYCPCFVDQVSVQIFYFESSIAFFKKSMINYYERVTKQSPLRCTYLYFKIILSIQPLSWFDYNFTQVLLPLRCYFRCLVVQVS